MKKIEKILILLFIIYKLFLVFIMWSGRNVPPEPDDSYSYISEIKKVAFSKEIFPDYLGSHRGSSNYTKYLPFTLGISIVSWLTGLNIDFLYFFNFIFGTIILAFAINFFLKSIISDKILYILSFLMFVLYNGNGAYHGFYWVVPTFYSFLLFLLILGMVFKKQTNYLILALLTMLFILVHPISIYALSIFIFYLFFNLIFKKQLKRKVVLRTLFVILFGILFFFLANLLFKKYNNNSAFSSNNPDSIKMTIAYQITKNAVPKDVEKITWGRLIIYKNSWENFLREYYHILFPNIIFLLIFIIFSIRTFFQDKRIIFIYFACLFFSLVSLLHPQGQRSLLFLWPVTFLLIGHFLKILWDDLKKYNKIFFYLCFLFLALFATYNNLHWIFYMKNHNNFVWDKQCAISLFNLVKDEEVIFYDNKMSFSSFHSQGLFQKKSLAIHTYKHLLQNKIEPKVDYLVVSSGERPQNIYIKPGVDLNLIMDCGYYKVYQII